MTPWNKKSKLTKQEVAQILEDFLTGGERSSYSWDGFTSCVSFEDEDIDSIRARCIGLSEEFPPESPGQYCNKQGLDVIRTYIQRLRHFG